eukprot:jgi/Mesvir1/12799/Mv22849-RA.1
MGNVLSYNDLERISVLASMNRIEEMEEEIEKHPGILKKTLIGGKDGPIHHAAEAGNPEVIRVLLKHGASVNKRNQFGQTPLMIACRYGKVEGARVLLECGADPLQYDTLQMMTPLHHAACKGKADCIRLLMEAKLPFDGRKGSSHGGRDSQHLVRNVAVGDMWGSSRFIDMRCDGGLSALHLAALNNHFGAIKVLVEYSANVQGKTIAMDGFSDGFRNFKIGAESTALHYAAANGNERICNFLIDHGADVMAENLNGWTPARIAIRRGHVELGKKLAIIELLKGKDQVQSVSRGGKMIPITYTSGRVGPD